MTKYVINVPDNTQWIQWMNVSEKDGSACFDYKAPEDLTPYVRSESYIDGLKKGQNEVWEFIKKIDNMKSSEIQEAFTNEGNFVWPFNLENYKEAKDRYEKWKVKKDEIRIGDEVIYNSRTKAVVLKPETKEKYGIILTGEFCTISVSQDDLEKTGRHFPEVEELVKKWSCWSISF